MNKALKITKVGNSAAVILPKDVLEKLRVQVGDTLHFTESDGGARISAYDPDFERQMAAAEEIMRKDRDILRELAK